jgi:hypothetical protein
MLVESINLKTNDDTRVTLSIQKECSYVDTKRGTMLKVPIKDNARDNYLNKIFNISFIDKYMYIPVGCIKSLKINGQ